MSRLSSLFARRYISSRNSLSVINIISRVSIFAVGVPVAAMVILLSVFNGFNGLVQHLYGEFDPDIMIVPVHGKVFERTAIDEDIFKAEDVAFFSHVLEESVLLEYRGSQAAAKLRGVDDHYLDVVPVDKTLVYGDYRLRFGDMEQVVVGQGLAYSLGVRTALYDQIYIYTARRGEYSSLLPIENYNVGGVYPTGIFALDAETDGSYVFTTIEFAQGLLDYDGKSSSIMVKAAPTARVENLKKRLQSEVGEQFKVLDRYEQKASMYRILQLEKFGIFFIILMVLVIASFSIVGSVVMLIHDKTLDIRIMYTMGADVSFVRSVFCGEGMLISALGIAGGLIVGLVISLVQQIFGFVKLDSASFLFDAYPVQVEWLDLVMIAGAAFVVTWVINKFTVSRMIPRSTMRL